MKLSKEVTDSVRNALRSEAMVHYIRRVIEEEVVRMAEDTDLVSLVAKSESEQTANAAADYLTKKGVEARAKYPTKLNSFSRTEKDGWGIMVRIEDVKKAAEMLGPYSKGLEFDPYTQRGK